MLNAWEVIREQAERAAVDDEMYFYDDDDGGDDGDDEDSKEGLEYSRYLDASRPAVSKPWMPVQPQ